ncbi:MAG: ankyrin repeat domain-containing protein [Paracoccaceae bacterium]|nr:ankyrin repeat domain-containing protein [Paracoccaceae bacterium]
MAIDPNKTLAELQEAEAAFEAEIEKLGLGDLDALASRDPFEGYPDIVRAAHEAGDAELVPTLCRLLDEGADVNAASPYGETAFRQCFIRSDFGAVRLLLERGADVSQENWTATHLAVLRGEVPRIERGAADLASRDADGRTPFLLACRVANVDAAATLMELTPENGRVCGDDGETPLHDAARSGSVPICEWVLNAGYPIDAGDRHGGTALLVAVEHNHLDVAASLLERGANPRLGRNLSAELRERGNEPKDALAKAANFLMEQTKKLVPMPDIPDSIVRPGDSAETPEMQRLLAAHGVPLEQFESDAVPVITGADRLPPQAVTPEMFGDTANPREGRANPERVDIPFWSEQIRTGRSGYAGEVACLGERDYSACSGPVWSFDRFGRTGTRLPDGRWVLIAGEHEDHYDRDFQIYNDVTVLHPEGRVDHYLYPRDVFPPTDFHTATLLGDRILLIGNLGYQDARQEGLTQILWLNLSDFSIVAAKTTGDNPGWISKHSAVLNENEIIVSGGKIEPGYTDNKEVFTLELGAMVWRRAGQTV